MSIKRPKDMTPDELEALTTESGQYVDIPITEDMRGRYPHGDTVRQYYRGPTKVPVYSPDDLAFWQDSKGRVWEFGMRPDGAWYKRQSLLSAEDYERFMSLLD